MRIVMFVQLVLLAACSGTSFSGSSGSKKAAPVKEAPSPLPAPAPAPPSSGSDHAADAAAAGTAGKTAAGCPALLDTSCAITLTHNQATEGVYSVAVTNPAPCDFKLPSVTVSGPRFDDPNYGYDPDVSITVPVGTYYNALAGLGGELAMGYVYVAHGFPLVPVPAKAPAFDNGFILVQPDHKAYLLADAGVALDPATPGYQSADATASQLSLTLGFGETKLLPATPDTVFKAGSVIALYDDTPDMAGDIKVDALVADAKPAACE